MPIPIVRLAYLLFAAGVETEDNPDWVYEIDPDDQNGNGDLGWKRLSSEDRTKMIKIARRMLDTAGFTEICQCGDHPPKGPGSHWPLCPAAMSDPRT